MSPYGWIIGAGALLSFGLYALRLRKRSLDPRLALWGLILGGALAVLGAKAGYLLLMLKQKGFEQAIGFSAGKLSVVCGAAALCAGIALTGRFVNPRAKGLDLLDAFAPCGALLLGFIRAGEYFLPGLGVGGDLEEGHFLARVPFGMQNEWGEWSAAVCVLEAFVALAFALVILLGPKRERFPGWTFELTAMGLALIQIHCESLLNGGMRWGFVRAEQVLCAVIVLALMLRGCLKSSRAIPGWKRFMPLIVTALCVAALVGVEFALDKGLLWLTNKLVRWPAVLDHPKIANNTAVSYRIMEGCLLVMMWMHFVTLKRREQA